MIVVDSSVAIAAFASWNEHHDTALRLLDEAPRLPAHEALETYSVLTRLPPPHRASPPEVEAFLSAEFPAQWLTLPARKQQGLVRTLTARSITGGAVYDALIAATAASHGATLVSFDRRAVPTYEAMGATVRVMS